MLVLKLYFEIINDYLFNFCNEKQSYYEKKKVLQYQYQAILRPSIPTMYLQFIHAN